MPVYPQLCAMAGALGWKTQAEIFNRANARLEPIDAAIELVGKPDMGISGSPGDAAFGMGMVCRAPGRELGEDELYQFLELPYIKDSEEYKTINQIGYGKCACASIAFSISICPGYFYTPLTKETLDSDFFQANARTMIPVERYGDEGELDSTTIFPASPASTYVTGIMVPVDGGYTCM